MPRGDDDGHLVHYRWRGTEDEKAKATYFSHWKVSLTILTDVLQQYGVLHYHVR